MLLMRIGSVGQERPVVRPDPSTTEVVDVSDVVEDFDEQFFADGGLGSLSALVAERLARGRVVELEGERIGSPIARPHQILCVGLNFTDHATETGQAVPAEPIIFNKAPNTLVGPDDDVLIPRSADTLDWEVELGVVIGRRAYQLRDVDEATEVIAGYVLVNDVSERTFQLHRGGQWVKGKSAPTFNPCGPWLATPEDMPSIDGLDMWLDVNGQRRQTGNTRTMLFAPAYVICYLSQFMVLEPGDLVNTGTPPGVGMAADPPTYLRDGDVVELGIEGLGRQRQQIRATP